MAFTVRDFEDLTRLLDKHPEWLEALRQRLLTKELLQVPKTLRGLSTRMGKVEKSLESLSQTVQTLAQSVAALAEAQRRHYEEFAAHRQEFLAYRQETDRRFAELAEAQRRTEERVGRLEEAVAALAEAQRRHYEEFAAHRQEFLAYREETERRFAELAEAQRQTQLQIQELVQTVGEIRSDLGHMRSTLDRFAQVIGSAVEERMIPALRAWVESQGGTLLGPVVSMTLDGIGEVDGVAQVRWPDGREGWLLVTAKTKVWPRSIEEFVKEILTHPQARRALREKGVRDPVWPVVFGLTIDDRAPKAADTAKVGLLSSQEGIIVPPVPWSLEQGTFLSD
ncbi:hypothetical protein [Thermoflexus sp.]|uniref:hypothetical protein n=1 Tax=Thermoflexus sp. TaxID=1969742 RepID=UPI0026358A36|nr:hypothetical protein [Thermoflexus sp.]MCX7690465.1 hypothetical protein [Thermoflexus sp.]